VAKVLSLDVSDFWKAGFPRTRQSRVVCCPHFDGVISQIAGDLAGGSSERAEREPEQDRKLWDTRGRQNCSGCNGNSICLCQILKGSLLPPHSAF